MSCWICEGGCPACDWAPLESWDTTPIRWAEIVDSDDPTEDCPVCDGDGADFAGICPGCHGRGWLTEADHEQVVAL